MDESLDDSFAISQKMRIFAAEITKKVSLEGGVSEL